MTSKIPLILFLIATSVSYSQRDIRVLSSDFNSITIEYSPEFIDTSIITIDSKTFRNAEFSFGSIKNLSDFGLPTIYARNISIGVPSEFGNTIEVLSTVYKEISGQLIPVPYPVQDTFSVSFEYKPSSEYYSSKSDENIVNFGSFGLVRDVGSQDISINPVKFDAAFNKIKLYTKIVFKVNFANSGLKSTKPAGDFLDGVLINYDVAKFWNNQNADKKLNKIAVTNSVLASGKWIRFEAPEEGIYKIGKSELSLFGIDANIVDPRTIKIYNNGGKELPESIADPRPNDLEENAIVVIGQDDGKFDEGDYILFYGRGASFWDYDNGGSTIKRFFNPYSQKNYYWITSGGNNGKRVADKSGLSTNPTAIQTTTSAFADWEIDKINLGKSGRQFLGDDFSTSVTSRSYTNSLNGITAGSPVNYNFRFAVGSPSGLTLKISENGNQIFSQYLSGYGTSPYIAGSEYINSAVFNGVLPSDRSVLNFTITPQGVTSVGYLDYFTIQYLKDLRAFSDNLTLFSNELGGIIEYQLNSFSSSDIKVFDVTNYSDVKLVTNYSMLSGGECRFQFDESTTNRSKYLAVGASGYKTASNPVEIQNSNLHGEELGAKYIIVTHKNFREAANSLKAYKETQAPITISTYVADIDQIYNEFSGGLVDPSAVRDYLKYAFDNWQIEPEYVLLFGKGTYDYKNVEGFGDNFVPTWQSIQSLALINSYTTDDYFVKVSGNNDPKVDLALGRITCTNITDANNIVAKIKNYELNQEKGKWRNLITLVADDGYTTKGPEGVLWEHTRPSENIANTYLPKFFDVQKIYSAAYPDVITGQGRRKPQVNQAIVDAINNGTLLINYIGHGSPELWAHEVILEKSVILPQMVNDKYFFLCAATCDFGYFDIPNYQSAAEAFLFLPNSGAIGVFSAARLVYSSQNHNLNYALVDTLFKSQRDTLNLVISIGKASFLTKQTNYTVNDQKYNIFGDPTLRLLVPQYTASIDSINSQNLSSNVQVKALSQTRVEGTILRPDNSIWQDFNGEGQMVVYDAERSVYLERISYPQSPFYMKQPGGIIFNGRISVTNGKFSEKFIVPKDISYENRNGKVLFYFLNNEADGVGFTDKIIVGGTDSSVTNDGKGPNIEVFFDNVEYNNSYLVNKNPKLIVKLEDETGLNTTGTGVGHKLEGILNQEINNPIDFTNYFTGDLDAGGKSGSINYHFNSLENGDQELLVKAWDVFNNFSEENTFFTVVDGNDLVIRDVYNYPNPFIDRTQFTFQQNLSQPIDVKIKIYTIAGRLIKEIENFNVNEKFVVIDWDGRDADGDQLANGTYLYKLIIKSVDGEFSKSVLGKLAVIK